MSLGKTWRDFARHLAVLATFILLGSCAYYNIYWTAEQEYRKAASGKAFAEFWDPFAQEKATGENLKNVDSCIKRCGKILLLYPKSKWVDDALVLMGNCFVVKGEYASALRKYEELLKFYPSSDFADEAKYMKAYTHVLEGSTEEALVFLETQAGGIKGKEWQERVVFLLGRIYQKAPDCDKAVADFEIYLKRFPGGRKAADVTLALGDCLTKMGRQSDAIGFLEPLAKREDMSGAMASIELGRAYRALGQNERALGIFQGLSDKPMVDSARARAKIEAAISLDDLGMPQEAIGALSVADSLGKASLGVEARYRIGLIYEQRLGDFAKATTSYDEAAKTASDYGRLASKRAAALKAVSKYEQALSDSTAQALSGQAANRFLLAETYLMDLGLTARAEQQFRVLSDSLSVNPFTARSMLALASLLDARGDTLSRGYYKTVMDSFPNTVYANIARARLALPLMDIVVAPPETSAVSDTTAEGFVGPPVLPPEEALQGPPEVPEEGAVGPAPGEIGPPDTTFSARPGASGPAMPESLGVGGGHQPLWRRGPPDTTLPWHPPLQDTTSRDTTHLPGDTPVDTTRSPGSEREGR